MRKVRLGKERQVPQPGPSPWPGRWVSPLFDNVSHVKVTAGVPQSTWDAVSRAYGTPA